MRAPLLARVLWSLLLLGLASGLRLWGGEPLVVLTEVRKVGSDREGHEIYLDADKARPADVLIYRASYTNQGEYSLREIVALLPIPPGLIYVEGSASPQAAEGTQDGNDYFSLTGGVLPPVGTWRALRWAPRNLAPGEKFVISLRVRVLAPGSADASPSR